MNEPREPLIHSHITDCIPDDHPKAWDTIMCVAGCGTMVHASNNECMATWVETGRGEYCWNCFVAAVRLEDGEYSNESASCLEDHWGLPPQEKQTGV